MANKLKNMRLTSVDLVRNGANQEADICLFKSADPDDPVQPTTEEKNIFKRFINWLRENPTEAAGEPTDPETVEKAYSTFESLNASRENNEKLWQYTNALCESIRSIQMDQDLDKDQKYQLMAQSLDQFEAAMDDLISALCKAAPSRTEAVMAKSDPEEDEEEDDWDEDEEEEWDEDDEEVEKFNPNHDASGRFASGGGGAAGGAAGGSKKKPTAAGGALKKPGKMTHDEIEKEVIANRHKMKEAEWEERRALSSRNKELMAELRRRVDNPKTYTGKSADFEEIEEV